MTTTTDDLTAAIANAAAHVAETAERLQTAQRTYDAARAARERLGYEPAGTSAKIRLVTLQAEAALEEATARLAECQRVHHVARDEMWAPVVRRAYVNRERARQRAALTAARALEAELRAGLADRQAVAQQLRCVDSGAHPDAAAVSFVQALESSLRQLDPPPPPSPPPPRPGTVRLRCTKAFHDPDGGFGIVRRPGDIFDTREEYVRELRAQELAEPVEA